MSPPLSSLLGVAVALPLERRAWSEPGTTFYPCWPRVANAPNAVFAHWRSWEAFLSASSNARSLKEEPAGDIGLLIPSRR